MSRLLPFSLALALLATLGPVAAAADGDVRWRLARSDFLRYERTAHKRKAGEEVAGDTKIVTVHGHDLRDEGQYAPASAVRDDLFQWLAFRLPRLGTKTSPIKKDVRFREAGNLRIKGSIQIETLGPRLATLRGTYAFASRGKVAQDTRWLFSKGTATTTAEFDLKEGVIRSARIQLTYTREDRKQNGPAGMLKRTPIFTYRLKAVERARPKDLQARIDKAIDRGVAHLKTLQRGDGTWKPHGDYDLGTTALAVFTLAACGVPRDDPKLKTAIDWIFKQEAERTYERATCLMAIDRAWTPPDELKRLERGQPITSYERALPPARMAWVRRTAAALETSVTGGGGSWGYPAKPRSALRFDTSNTQYAVLGLRAAARMGHAVSERVWLGVIRHCKEVQERKGPKGRVSLVRQGQAIPNESGSHRLGVRKTSKVAGFAYATIEAHDHVNASMTCAGITMLLIARDELRRARSKKFDKKLASEVDAMIVSAWAWLDRHWAMDRNPGHPNHRWYYYFLYSLERAAVLDTVKRVGGKDWYYEGAMQLLHRQGEEKGDWNEKGQNDTPPTCFGLLFLKRGTSPLGGPVTGK